MLASEGEKRERFVLVFCFFLVRITVPRDGRSYTLLYLFNIHAFMALFTRLYNTACATSWRQFRHTSALISS